MRTKRIWVVSVTLLAFAGSSMASMMGTGTGMGGWMGTGMGTGSGTGTGMGTGTGSGMGSGTGAGTGTGGQTGAGMMYGGGHGYGMKGAGDMMSSMRSNTLHHSYLTVLTPIGTADEAVAAVNAFLSDAQSGLQIAELWEYATVYKAEIADADGNLAFDILADKVTGAVQPAMGLSMMLNASYGATLHKTAKFGRKLSVTVDDSTADAQAFLDQNSSVLAYTLETPEAYPGFYKFHTTDSAGQPGMDIMVNGYNGEIWMDSVLGAPISEVTLP